MSNDAFVLTMHGIRQRLYGGEGSFSPTQPPVYPGSQTNTGIHCLDIKGVSDIVTKPAKYGGVAIPSKLTLRARERNGLLSKLFSPTAKGVLTTRLLTTLVAELGTITLFADGDISEFIVPGYLYIGHETLFATAKDNEAQTFTLDAALGRGANGSLACQHLRDNLPARSFKPLITQQPINWVNRQCVLSLHKVLGHGSTAFVDPNPTEELIRGSIQVMPVPDSAGNYTISIVDALSRWDRSIGSGLESTELTDHYYYSDGVTACKLNFNEYIERGAICGPSQTADVTANRGAGGGGAGTISVVSVEAHRRCFGTARGHNPGLPANGPIGLRKHTGHDATPSIANGYGLDGLSDTYTLSEDNASSVDLAQHAINYRVYNESVFRRCTQDRRPYLAEGLHRWPAALVSVFNASCNTSDAVNGALYYIDASLSSDCTKIVAVDSGYVFDRKISLGPRNQDRRGTNIWYPALRGVDHEIDNGTDYLVPAQDLNDMEASLSTDLNPTQHNFLQPATAFWQGGKYILVKDDVFPPASEEHPGYIRVVLPGSDSGGTPLEGVLEYVSITPQVNSDGASIGYRVTLSDLTVSRFSRNPYFGRDTDTAGPFGNWGGTVRRRARLEAYAVLSGDPRRILLKLMLSGYGSTSFPDVNFSTLPRTYGLKIDPQAVDQPGILNYTLPRGTHSYEGFKQKKPIQAKKLIEGILISIGAALVMKTIDGVRKITLANIRNPVTAGRTIFKISNARWLASGRPGSGRLDDKQTSWQINTNWDNATQKFASKDTFHDADVIDASDGAQNTPVVLNIPGLRTQGRLDLLGIYQQLRARYGSVVADRRIYSGAIPWSLARRISGVGEVVIADIDTGYTESGVKGVKDAVLLVISISKNPITKVCRVVLLYDDTNVGSYAPVCTVLASVDANTVDVSSNDFSYPDKEDYLFFLNDSTITSPVPVECVHVAEEESNTFSTITARVGGRLTVPMHGLAAGDRLRVRNWDNTLTYLQNYVHLASSAGIGAAEDNSFIYS